MIALNSSTHETSVSFGKRGAISKGEADQREAESRPLRAPRPIEAIKPPTFNGISSTVWIAHTLVLVVRAHDQPRNQLSTGWARLNHWLHNRHTSDMENVEAYSTQQEARMREWNWTPEQGKTMAQHSTRHTGMRFGSGTTGSQRYPSPKLRVFLARLCRTLFIFGKLMRLHINETASASFFF